MAFELRSYLSTEDGAEEWDISKRSEMANAILAITISSGVSWGLTLQAEFRIATDHGMKF